MQFLPTCTGTVIPTLSLQVMQRNMYSYSPSECSTWCAQPVNGAGCSLPRKRVGVGVSALFTLPLCTYVLTINNSHPEHIYMNMYIDQHTDY